MSRKEKASLVITDRVPNFYMSLFPLPLLMSNNLVAPSAAEFSLAKVDGGRARSVVVFVVVVRAEIATVS